MRIGVGGLEQSYNLRIPNSLHSNEFQNTYSWAAFTLTGQWN